MDARRPAGVPGLLLAMTLFPPAFSAVTPAPAHAGAPDRRVHVDTCVELTPEGPPPERPSRRARNLPACPVRHVSDNPYQRLARSDHKYIVLTEDAPIRLEVDGPGPGLRHLFLWKYRDGRVVDGGSYTITIVRDGAEWVRKTFPIRVYPKHVVYGSDERMRTPMTAGTHTYEIRLDSAADGDVVYYWKVASLDGIHLNDAWRPLPAPPP